MVNIEFQLEVKVIDNLVVFYEEFRKEIGKVIIGQEDVVCVVIILFFSNGYSLLVGVFGLVKIFLVSMIVEVFDFDFKCIQFMFDLMFFDIIGLEILDEDWYFKFMLGLLFVNIVLVDEINCILFKIQVVFLEAMQECFVIVSGVCYKLFVLFFVLVM